MLRTRLTDFATRLYMRTKTVIGSIISLLLLLITLRAAVLNTSAQSDKAVPKQVEAKSKFAADPNADKYKLVFSKGYPDSLLFKDPPKNKRAEQARKWLRNRAHLLQIKNDNQASFVEQLNKVGEQGYRLFSSVDHPLVGVAKVDEAQYEYASFETTDSANWYDVEPKYAPYAKQGFSMYGIIAATTYCFTETCEDMEGFRLFLLERKKGIDTPANNQIKQIKYRWGVSRNKLYTSLVKESIAEGFYPIHLFYYFYLQTPLEVLLQHTTTIREPVPYNSEVQVASSLKEINKLAQQGFRLDSNVKWVGLMYRHYNAAPAVSYVWLDTMKKGFEQQLAQLQANGASYRMRYKMGLLFEQPTVGNNQRREYKVLGVNLQRTENVEELRVEFDLTPASKETVKTLNQLTREGFEVRDLFESDEPGSSTINILLERPSSIQNKR